MQAKGHMFTCDGNWLIISQWSDFVPNQFSLLFFSPYSFLTGTNELAQSSADNSLCCLAGRILHLYSEGYRFVTLTNVFVVILLYFSFVSVIRRRGDFLRRICVVTSKVCAVLLSSVSFLIKIPIIFFQFVFNGQQKFPDILHFTDSLQPTKISPVLKTVRPNV